MDDLSFAGLDNEGRKLFRHKKSGTLTVDVDGILHTCTEYGEPCIPLGWATPPPPYILKRKNAIRRRK